MQMLEEFKKFALRGNVVDLAIGVVIGAAFGAIVASLVADIIMPIIGAITGGLDFSKLLCAPCQQGRRGPRLRGRQEAWSRPGLWAVPDRLVQLRHRRLCTVLRRLPATLTLPKLRKLLARRIRRHKLRHDPERHSKGRAEFERAQYTTQRLTGHILGWSWSKRA